jgi:putative ABC transport system permease protein
MVTANYFRTMKMHFVRGRDFSASDQTGSPWVIVVNEAMARQYWRGQDPIGKRLTFSFYEGDDERPREVVGVVADTSQYVGESQSQPVVYAPHRQQLVRQRASLEGQRMRMSYVLRTAGDPMALASSVLKAVAGIDPSQPVTQIRTVDSFLYSQMQGPRFLATLFGIFGAVSLVIAAIGIYGVTSHSVTQRHHEFGIRRALGAGTGDVLGLVVRRSLTAIALGVVLGAGASLLLARFIAEFLWGVTPSDPATRVTIATLLFATGLVACLVPGCRATRVDPQIALRHD